MKAYLLYRDRDADLQAPLPALADTAARDLELPTILDAMSQGDPFLRDVAQRTLLTGLTGVDAVEYRQQILQDCLAQPTIVREVYRLATDALLGEKRVWRFYRPSPEMILSRGLEVLGLFVRHLHSLREVAASARGKLRSPGLTRFFSVLEAELSDDFFRSADRHLTQLRFPDGILMSASLGEGLAGDRYVLRTSSEAKRGWAHRLLDRWRPSNSFEIGERDESGHRNLAELRDRGVNLVANAVAQSNDHVVSFFELVRAELGFYVGCLNLHEQLTRIGSPTCVPEVRSPAELQLRVRGLYEPCLALRLGHRTVSNDLSADGKRLVFVCGANQGGKSTFLRSVGLIHLMLQAGMFVPAEACTASLSRGVYTHFKREEDATMTHGKLEEELGRMHEIVEHIPPESLLLCNESLSSTNEREGSEIARQILRALGEDRVRIVFVTFLYDLVHGFAQPPVDPSVLLLNAERLPDGRRTYRMVEGAPLPTSYGEDLYRKIFGAGGETAAPEATGSHPLGGPKVPAEGPTVPPSR